MNDTEIEIQTKVEHVEPLIQLLKKKGTFQYKARQKDEYFTPIHRNFIEPRPMREWLRLRDSDGKYSTTYKNWYFNEQGKGTHCDEYETKIENIDSLRKIYLALDFKHIITVEKTREVWTCANYEIAIDQVEGLGNFVEVELKGDTEGKAPMEIQRGMVSFLKDIGCGKVLVNNGGYPHLLLFPKEAEYYELK